MDVLLLLMYVRLNVFEVGDDSIEDGLQVAGTRWPGRVRPRRN